MQNLIGRMPHITLDQMWSDKNGLEIFGLLTLDQIRQGQIKSE